jgi:hypothetical protein
VVRGQVITTTAEHPFYVAGEERFIPAGELTLEDQLVDSQGRPIAIDAIRVTDRLITVYNLRVADLHTYFVGGKVWSFDAWVHNAGQIDYVGGVKAPSGAPRLPSSRYGKWLGAKGNSAFELNNKTTKELGLDKATTITFRNGRVDFGEFSQGNFNVRGMTGDHAVDMPLIHEHIAKRMGMLKRDGTPNAAAAQRWLSENNLTPHHAGGVRVQLIDYDLHNTIRHTGVAFDLRS